MSEDYGHRLMPTVLRHEARRNPQRTFAIAAKTNDLDDGFRHVTFQQMARATNYVSNWLQDRFENGSKPSEIPTLTFIGVPDLCYNILFYAAVQCRYKVFLPSPRNTTAVNVSLLEQTNCSKLVYSRELSPVAKTIHDALPTLRCEQFPLLDDLLSAPDTEYAFDYTFDELCHDPVMILHSSGSTGLPKPITQKHGTFATYDVRDWPTVPDRINHDGLTTFRFPEPNARSFDVFPPFHVMGVMTKLIVPIFNLTVPIIGPALRPPSGALAAQLMRIHKPRVAAFPPTIIEQLCHEPGSDEIFKSLDYLIFAGGPLADVVGNKLSKLTNLCQLYGATESGQIRQLIPKPDDWAYFEFHPNEHFELQPEADGLSELVMYTGPDTERTSALYHNFPQFPEYRTKDLFEPHPTKPNLWKFKGRKDDILVFSSGEKLNPIPVESFMTTVPGVKGALVVGQAQRQSALIIELADDAVFQSKDTCGELWPSIEEANALLPAHGRVSRAMVIIANTEKPFVRAGKGTVIRRMTEKLYTDEIKQVYDSITSKAKPRTIALRPSAFRVEDIKSLLRAILDNVSVDSKIGDEDNLYSYGMDSVKTAESLGHLKASLQAYKPESNFAWLSLDTIYLNPTIQQLASVVLTFLNEGKPPVKRDRIAEMTAKIAEYTNDLPQQPPPRVRRRAGEKFSVAVTGTTGFLGGHLLAKLVNNPQVNRIYCLNRSSAAKEKFDKLNLSHNVDMVFLKVQFGSSKLGLVDDDYKRLLEDCDLILHNAWRLDFNLSLNSFEDNLQSVKQFINLSAESQLRPRIVYVSSISSTGVWASEGAMQQMIPERIVEDLNTTMKLGYGESKRVSEHVLDAAAQQSRIPVSVIRMGQIAPSNDGGWPENDIVPVFMRTCKASNMVASDFVENIDWVPVDGAASVVNDIIEFELKDTEGPDIRVFNVLNPNETLWADVVNTVQSWCGHDAKAVSMRQWVQSLRDMENNGTADLSRLPALRMLNIFDQIANHGPNHKYATDGLTIASKSHQDLPALGEQQLRSWLDQL